MREITSDSPDADLPFSEAIQHGDTIYVSGQGPINLDTGEIIGDTAGEQTEKTLENIERILTAGGSSLADVVQARIYLTDMSYYDEVNEVYRGVMSTPFPARAAVEVSDLPVDIKVEIEVTAAAPTTKS